jgi:small subunit ribosomal protein S4
MVVGREEDQEISLLLKYFMASNTDAKCELCRREQTKLYLKGDRCYTEKCAVTRKQSLPGKTTFFHSRLSNYGQQLREKQKVKRMYGISESQMKNIYKRASATGGDKGLTILQLLERRLDNVVYLLGLATSRAHARQMVGHGHILVNEKKVDIPSYEVSIGDKIEIKKASSKTPTSKNIKTPKWLKKTAKGGSVEDFPQRVMIDEGIKENLVVEFYSK